jgi:putative tricarboxylic transport membrane protein
LLVAVALEFGPTEICSIMLLGLLAGATMSRGSPLEGVAMTIFGLLCGGVGTDVTMKLAFFAMLRGTLVAALFGTMPGTGPTIMTLLAYALERKVSKTPARFGK